MGVAQEASVTLRSALRGRGNGIGFIRLIAASLVVVGHSASFGGYGRSIPDQLTGGQIPEGRLPVDVFFVLSGYLITESWFRLGSVRAFAWHRFLRIYPAYLVCVALTAIALGPAYLILHLPLVTGVPAGEVNGALWTLPIEAWCYIAVAVLGLTGLLRWPVVAAIGLGAWVWFALLEPPSLTAITSWQRLATFFAMGSLAWFARDALPMRWWAFAGALGAMALAVAAGVFWLAAPPLVAYATLYLGARIPFRLDFDMSYGTYIYGTLVIIALRGLGAPWPVFVTAALAITWSIAAVSWVLVERPALRLKSLRWSVGIASPTPLPASPGR